MTLHVHKWQHVQVSETPEHFICKDCGEKVWWFDLQFSLLKNQMQSEWSTKYK